VCVGEEVRETSFRRARARTVSPVVDAFALPKWCTAAARMFRPMSMKLDEGEEEESSAAGRNFKLYCDKFLPLERAVHLFPDEEKVLQVVLKHAPAEWGALPLDMQLNILRAYVHEADRLKVTVSQTREIAKFRAAHHLASFVSNPAELAGRGAYDQAWPTRVAGEDQLGHVVMYDRVTWLKPEKMHGVELNQIVKCRAQDFEALFVLKAEISARRGHRVGKHVYILDLAGLELKHFTSSVKSTLQPVMAMCSNMFPETLWSLWLINAPASFRLVWSVVRSWLDPIVKAKVRMFGSQAKWLPAMNEVGVTLASLPVELGGSAPSESFKDVLLRMQLAQANVSTPSPQVSIDDPLAASRLPA
jgi:hypothetical protein